MSAPPPATPPSGPWQPLSVNERRVLGVLIEKQKTTPEAYPLSINALVTGSNQKTNRDPLLNLNDLDVEEALTAVQQRGLVMRITGGGEVGIGTATPVSKLDVAGTVAEAGELSQFTPLFAIDHQGVKLFAAPYAQRPTHESESVAPATRAPEPAAPAAPYAMPALI